MTLRVSTKSHGIVESGFFSCYTQFTRLGEYSFSTKHMCELSEHLANNPTARQGNILTYDLDKFWDGFNEHIQEWAEMLVEADKSWLPELEKFEVDRAMKRKQSEVSLEDEVNLYDKGKIIPVTITPKFDTISIGQYKLSSTQFGRMAVYLARGGFLGWMDGESPEFASSALKSIKESKNQLYFRVQREMRK